LNVVIKEQKEEETKISPPVQSKKVGRNDKCLCGSGIKYKYCCGSK
jgi:SEC-C motif-containing protein